MMVVGCRFPVVGANGSGSRLNIDDRQPPTANRHRGSALILSLVIAAVLALLATAFIITARVEHKAATNTLHGAQAEAACRAGLAAAIFQIETALKNNCCSIDDLAGWHGYFYPQGAEEWEDLCPDSWVAHYPPKPPPPMAGKRWNMPIAAGGDPAAALKRLRGFSSEYYVAVADLDGKLHCNPACYDNLLNDTAPAHQTQDMLDKLGLSSATIRDAMIKDTVSADWSLGQLRAKLIAEATATSVTLTTEQMNEAEKYFTVYPLVTDLSVGKGAIPRANSRVNINTARSEVLTTILSQIPSLASASTHTAGNLATYLAAKRPFANRSELENAIYDISPAGIYSGPVAPWGTGERLSEAEFNEILNSLNGIESSIYANNGRRDTAVAGVSGIYEYDFDQADPALQNQGGDPQPAHPASANWGTEVKFTSRFFHIYTLGRTVSADGRVTAERRMHAIYDSQDKKVLWLRWHFGAKANMTDP